MLPRADAMSVWNVRSFCIFLVVPSILNYNYRMLDELFSIVRRKTALTSAVFLSYLPNLVQLDIVGIGTNCFDIAWRAIYLTCRSAAAYLPVTDQEFLGIGVHVDEIINTVSQAL